MGITIHYKLKFEGDESMVQNRLKYLQMAISGLPVAEVKGLWKIDLKDDDESVVPKEDAERYRWAKIQAMPHFEVREDGELELAKDTKEYHGYVLHTWVGAGCESTNLSLVTKDGLHWKGQGFTKTQYAKHFVKAHLMVCAILDLCKRVGILDSVSDEAEYYETRDLEVLGKNINESTAMISGFLKVLTAAVPDIDVIEAPIKTCKNFVQVRKGRV